MLETDSTSHAIGRGLGPGFCEALMSGRTSEELFATLESDELSVLARAQLLLTRLAVAGRLRGQLRSEHGPLATLVRLPPPFVLPSLHASNVGVRLSRFTTLGLESDGFVLRNPLAPGPLIMHDPTLGFDVLRALAQPCSPRQLADELGEAAGLLAAILEEAGFAEAPDHDHVPADDPDLACWEPHDLAFHRRSRIGPHGAPVGPTRRLAHRIPPAPVLGPDRGGARVRLAVPTEPLSMSLGQVLATRRSQRAHAEQAIELDELAALLHHCARVRSLRDLDDGDRVSARPYPSAGARYPLELYLAVHRCAGLERGLYRYDPHAHELETIHASAAALERLLADASIGPGTPQVLISIAARFRRTTWKYETIAYALILKDAGVLMQTLQLGATAMGLACCMVGTGDPQRLADAIGEAVHVESSVAELVLGIPQPTPVPQPAPIPEPSPSSEPE